MKDGNKVESTVGKEDCASMNARKDDAANDGWRL